MSKQGMQMPATPAEIIETINNMSNEQQHLFYESLKENGLTDGDMFIIQAFAFYTKLWSCQEVYNAVKKEMGAQLYKEFTR